VTTRNPNLTRAKWAGWAQGYEGRNPNVPSGLTTEESASWVMGYENGADSLRIKNAIRDGTLKVGAVARVPKTTERERARRRKAKQRQRALARSQYEKACAVPDTVAEPEVPSTTVMVEMLGDAPLA
jgi:hypothetical protein